MHAPSQAEPLIELDQATVLRGEQRALDALSLRLPMGRHVAILGPNGCGKSSFIQLITRQLYPVMHADGRPPVRILGRHRWDVREIRTQLGVVSGTMHDDLLSLPGITAEDAVLGAAEARLAAYDTDAITPAMRQSARDALSRADALHLAGREYATLSTGEARRVVLARALAHGPRALLLDEPSAGLDVVARQRLLDTLRRLAREGTTLVLVTHHAEELIPEIGHIVLLRAGQIVAEGPRANVLTPALLGRAFNAPLRMREGDPPAFEFIANA
ncbi:MAG: ATP-binding cassette domain-containing protein [Thermomonas sp.]|uniref:ABC transporter ATP-binding protein n=1 Tax=Thermomonas sp. TaxID=1971895 RepID=UPI0039E420C8